MVIVANIMLTMVKAVAVSKDEQSHDDVTNWFVNNKIRDKRLASESATS